MTECVGTAWLLIEVGDAGLRGISQQWPLVRVTGWYATEAEARRVAEQKAQLRERVPHLQGGTFYPSSVGDYWVAPVGVFTEAVG